MNVKLTAPQRKIVDQMIAGDLLLRSYRLASGKRTVYQLTDRKEDEIGGYLNAKTVTSIIESGILVRSSDAYRGAYYTLRPDLREKVAKQEQPLYAPEHIRHIANMIEDGDVDEQSGAKELAAVALLMNGFGTAYFTNSDGGRFTELEMAVRKPLRQFLKDRPVGIFRYTYGQFELFCDYAYPNALPAMITALLDIPPKWDLTDS